MRRSETLEQLRPYFERARSFSGWDFSGIHARLLEPGPPWDYEALVREAASRASFVLDMGTGGGEFLARIRDRLPDCVVATEEWKVNVPVAKQNLSPLNVAVVQCQSRRLPFWLAEFDLVINRHEDLDPAEIARVLLPGGLVITQQVSDNNWKEARKHFPRMTDFGDLCEEYARGFEASGLKVTKTLQHDYKVAYTLREFVFMVAVTPWAIPDFNLEGDIDALLSLDAECHSEDGLVVTESRFLIVAEKPT